MVYSIGKNETDIEHWLQEISHLFPEKKIDVIQQACTLAQLAGDDPVTLTNDSCLQHGIGIANILIELRVDHETLAAAITYSSVRYSDLPLEDVHEQLGAKVEQLINGTRQMEALHNLRTIHTDQHEQHKIDNIRKMLLAMVDDVRVVLIKLAERLYVLRHIKNHDDAIKRKVAHECSHIYAPLANRLGIGQLKWQLEDLSFRYLHPYTYASISKSLKTRREEREQFVKFMIDELHALLRKANITHSEVNGRAKHIYSIHKKMQRKHVDIGEIYDALAVRILVPTIEDCYTMLGAVHSKWEHIPKEFDDYVTTPKPNGYRSIHTAIVAPGQKHVEIQLRTFEMHEEAELGFAAHWKYKESTKATSAYEHKISWLRQVMDWQKEVAEAGEEAEDVYKKIFDDRVYVFTPTDDVIDLPTGSTPLDFAYHVHSEVGHRCRGAKINGKIVQLTYELKTGDRVEVLTAKESKPSRDWMNPQLGYLKTSRARSKVHSWFKKQNYERNLADGQHVFEKELKRLGLKKADLPALAKKFNLKTGDDLLAAIGSGDVRIGSITSAFKMPTETKEVETRKFIPVIDKKEKPSDTGISIEGVGKLLTSIARCCKPIPGDQIIGYVTKTRGVTIHRQDCNNILNASNKHQERLLQASWGTRQQKNYSVDVIIRAYDRPGLMRDISSLLATDHIAMSQVNSTTNKKDHTAQVMLTIEIDSMETLSGLLARISQLPNVVEAKRQI